MYRLLAEVLSLAGGGGAREQVCEGVFEGLTQAAHSAIPGAHVPDEVPVFQA